MIDNSNGQSLPLVPSVKSNIFMAILIRWFRFQTYIGVTLTALMWILLCYFVFISNRQFDENNAFNLVEDLPDEKTEMVSLKIDD